MANPIQQAGGASEPTSFAPLHTNRIFTGLWTNRSLLRDAAVTGDMERYGFGRQDSVIGGQNTEISTRLTLIRRPGTNVYNSLTFPPIKRFYSFNTFTLTDETIRVLADTASTVYDATGAVKDANGNVITPDTQTPIWQKASGAGPTFFLGVGNILFFTNSLENKQWAYTSNQIFNWGIAAPTVAPTVSQTARPVDYPQRANNTVYGAGFRGQVIIFDPNTNTLQRASIGGVTGSTQPTFSPALYSTVGDGTVTWATMGNPSTSAEWHNNYSYAFGDAVIGHVSTSATTTTPILFALYDEGSTGISGNVLPNWTAGLGTITHESTGVQWINLGVPQQWTDIGQGATISPGIPLAENIPYMQGFTSLDPNGYLQSIGQIGKTAGTTPTNWATALNAQTVDGNAIWINQGPLSVAGTAAVQYGYAYKNSVTGDISNMSPASPTLTLEEGNQVVITGPPSSDTQVDTIVIYRTAQGGSTFLELGETPNPSGTWTFIDTTPDSGLNVTIQAQVNGEGTPLPHGATCMAYHLQRIFVAVGNVVYVSSGPDAIASTSSGNAGFNTTFTAQSKIIYLWVSSLGLVVFTTRDTYIILGSATSSDPLYMTTFLDGMPLGSYDAFTKHLTTPYLMTTTNMVLALDPSAGITEASFPIADVIAEDFDPTASYVTFHVESSKDHALYVADGSTGWYRMAATSAPESGFGWSNKANLIGAHSAIQSVEVSPGKFRLLIGPGPAGGPIWFRDQNARTDTGTPYAANATFGSIVLAQPGQLAALAFITLESLLIGSKPALSILMGEIAGKFEQLNRTRQDPTNLPPSTTLYSDRYHFMQNQTPAWCRHFQMDIAWPAEDAANELLTFTIFGQTWNEYRSQ